MITDTEVRKIASEWYGGQWTGLYAMASSGAIIVNEEFNTVPATHRNERGERVLTSDPDTTARLTALEEIDDQLVIPQRVNYPQVLTKRERKDLTNLMNYIKYHGPRDSVPGWSDLRW